MRSVALALAAFVLPALASSDKPTILGVFAHPDDEVWWGTGALLAMYAAQGHDVYLVTVTSGQIGVTSHAQIPAGPELGAVREEELRCSARALGIQPPFAFGFFDQGLTTSLVMDEFAKRLRQVIAQVKPDVVITHGPEGLSGHIDHRITSVVTTEVFQEQQRLGYQPRKLYYIAYPESRIPVVAGATDGRRVYRTTSDALITTAIDSSEGRAAYEKAVECHASQMTTASMTERKNFHQNLLRHVVHLRLAIAAGAWPQGKEDSLFQGIAAP